MTCWLQVLYHFIKLTVVWWCFVDTQSTPDTQTSTYLYNTFLLIIGGTILQEVSKAPLILHSPTKPTVCAFSLSSLYKPRWTMTEDKGKKHRQRWLTDFLLPEDTSTPKRWFLLDDEQLWIHKQWSQLCALLTRDGGKTSEAVSGSMAIKPTQGLCFSPPAGLPLKHRVSDQTHENISQILLQQERRSQDGTKGR